MLQDFWNLISRIQSEMRPEELIPEPVTIHATLEHNSDAPQRVGSRYLVVLLTATPTIPAHTSD